jgi:hypothetical protein
MVYSYVVLRRTPKPIGGRCTGYGCLVSGIQAHCTATEAKAIAGIAINPAVFPKF